METITDLGWAYPSEAARKVHYFAETKNSLCREHTCLGVPERSFQPEKGHPPADDCVTCRTVLDWRGVR